MRTLAIIGLLVLTSAFGRAARPDRLANPGMALVGRSHYWGQKLQGQEKPMTTNAFRIGTFEPVAK